MEPEPRCGGILVRTHALQRRRSKGASTGGGAAFTQPRGEFSANSGGWAEAPEEKDIASEKDHYIVLGVPTDVAVHSHRGSINNKIIK